jgi:hypothetical protein
MVKSSTNDGGGIHGESGVYGRGECGEGGAMVKEASLRLETRDRANLHQGR